ncbi:MAG: cobalt-precorrin-5B (C(1))-methyltransferase [Alphaproteobacteria bacterium]|nr:cobalt-precorrin-5B (C(1))-methyltransferase [Alphaproteobacteria bacterium]
MTATNPPNGPLRKGWTTGACATAATVAAYTALLTGRFPDPVTITLPRGEEPSFALVRAELDETTATAAIVKDAGDDPDVTHGATIVATVTLAAPGTGVRFRAGAGVGTVTRAGLPLAVGEPAINPVPRRMMAAAVADLAARHRGTGDAVITIAVPGGEALAAKTWNPRLGIVGGLSILGTTGIVIPYSCSAWIHAIHRGIDVARAAGLDHLAGATGTTSEATVKRLYGLPDLALIDMGDFCGGMLKYLRRHPVGRVTIAGGFAKMAKLAAGHLDLHSSRSQLDPAFLAGLARDLGENADLARDLAAVAGGGEALVIARAAGVDIASPVAARARATALATLSGETRLDVVVVDRDGTVIAHAGA